MKEDKIPVLEEFVSYQGEGLNIGRPYYFIRVGGCPLRCNWCDSEYSWKVDNGKIQEVSRVAQKALETCERYGIEWISITGGEPLLYPEQLLRMITSWKIMSYGKIKTHIETSGRFYNEKVHNACSLYSPDAKTPITGEQMVGYFKGIEFMRDCDQVKCLISNNHDLDYAYDLNKVLDGSTNMVLQPFNKMIFTNSTSRMTPEQEKERITQMPVQSQVLRSQSKSLNNVFELLKERMQRETWKRVIVTPQIHVTAYGNKPLT